MHIRPILATFAGAICLPFFAHSEVMEASPAHFTLHLAAETELTPDQVWTRLVEPSSWWLPEHTYSGSAENLSLDSQAGGVWREDWDTGSVWHGTVLQAQPGKTLVLSAPFGPLQGLAVNSVWTISLTPTDTGGTEITFDHVTNGTAASKLHELAPAVDYVKSEALKSLARPADR